MAETTATTWRCDYCGTPILRTDTLVQVGEATFCCPSCDLAAERGDLAHRSRRSGGYVLACAQCGTPILFREVMVTRGPNTYCCGNCAEVAHLVATGQPVQGLPRPVAPVV